MLNNVSNIIKTAKQHSQTYGAQLKHLHFSQLKIYFFRKDFSNHA